MGKVPGGLPKVELSDGRTIEFNLYSVTRGELRDYYKLPAAERNIAANDLYQRVTGLSEAELDALPFPDWFALDRKFAALIINPLTDPN